MVNNHRLSRGHMKFEFLPWVGKTPLEEEVAIHSSVFLPGESHGQRNLAGSSPRGQKELDTVEQLSTQTFYMFI